MRFQDPLIIGAGPAGCAAAIVLAKGGARPLVLERTRETGDALCGGFLSWRSIAALGTLGIDDLGGHKIDRVRVFAGKRTAEARLPRPATGVSRYRLDSVMQEAAIDAGAVLERDIAARSCADGRVLFGDQEIVPETLFLATGKHDLRGLARPKPDGDAPLGLRVRIPPTPELQALLASTIELHLFDGGYAGLLLQEDGSANLCMALRKSCLAEADGDPQRLLASLGQTSPALDERLAFLSSEFSPDAIANVPYGWRAQETVAGIFRLGDQAACIPSLAGEGMGIAIASGIAGAKAWQRGGAQAAPHFQRDFARRTKRPVAVARFLWEQGERPKIAAWAVPLLALVPGLATLAARLTRIGD